MLAFRFTETPYFEGFLSVLPKASICGESKPKICISFPLGSYKFVCVLKNIEFQFKAQKVCLRFYWKTSVRGENKLKIHISSPQGPYSVLFRRFGIIHNFLWCLKNIEFRLKTQRSVFGFTKKHLFVMKTGQKSVFHQHKGHILAQLGITVLYKILWGFKKYWVSTQNPKGLALSFTEKRLSVA